MLRSNVGVKVKDHGQGQRLRLTFDIRGSALPSAAKTKEKSLPVQGDNLCVCNQGCMQIIVQMRSISF